MGTALLVVAALIGVLLLVLVVPIDVAFQARGIEPFEAQAQVGWLFGLVRFRLPMRRKARGTAREADKAPAIPVAKPRRRVSGSRVLQVLKQAGFRARVQRLFGDLVRALHLRELRMHLRLGLGDPADTGVLWGLLAPWGVLLGRLPEADVRVEPVFLEAALDFDAGGRMRLVPLQVIGLAIAFVLSPVSIRAWWTLRRGGG